MNTDTGRIGSADRAGHEPSQSALSRPDGDHPIARFTPGPWVVQPAEADRPYIRIRGTRLGERYKIANALGGDNELEREEAQANAGLIAKAPEFYDALDAIRSMLRSYDGQPNQFGDVFKIADAALARGEQ